MVEDYLLHGFRLYIPKNVYEPREDSLLLAKAVEDHARGLVLDIGTGSGLQALVAARKPGVTQVIATDVNEFALQTAEANARENRVAHKISFKKSDLFEKLREANYAKAFDTIVFNPPYLPTGEGEKLRGEINAAFDGGVTGRDVIDAFLKEFDSFLRPNGVLLMAHSSLANNKATLSALKKKGFDANVVGREKFFFEELIALKAAKKKSV
ncbi:tRNA (adenine(22)-N(1))-methyltransferase TrmK [Candidatus Micrarchaeota archaeon]|nr:tRNA (adenine(22)-N(1))-methyltransferase TrmK [Candidatus Micrarchaeota archaeon]